MVGADTVSQLRGWQLPGRPGTGLPFRINDDIASLPNMVWLYRRPILDYWAEHEETLGHIVRHVLIHEIGHHFGLSDEEMAEIEADADADEADAD